MTPLTNKTVFMQTSPQMSIEIEILRNPANVSYRMHDFLRRFPIYIGDSNQRKITPVPPLTTFSTLDEN